MGRKAISNSFTVNTIEDGKSAPYYFQEWYAWSNVESTLNVSVEPTPNSGWTTSIPSQGSYAYLWRKSIKYVWDGHSRNYYPETAQYFRMSGTNGTSIKIKGSVPTVQDLSNISNPQDGDAYVVDATGHLWMWSYEASQWVDIGQFKGENGITYFVHIAWATNVVYSGSTITSVEGFVTSKNPNDTTHLWMGILVDTNSGQDSDNATLYTWSYTKGVQGERGRTGRFYYYAGEFDNENVTDTFVINDAQAPFFKHIESGQTRYHVFNPDENPGHNLTMNEMWAISSNWNNRPWEAMTNDFKYLMTEAIFSNFAHFGSAIISGDWMISQHGTINGIASTDYTRFDSDYPNTDHEYQDESHNFIPNYCVDLLTGASYQQNAYIIGKLYSSIGEIGGFVLGQNFIGDIQSSGQQFIGSRIYSGGGAMFGNNTNNGYALQTSGTVEMVGNGKNIIINTRTGSASQHGDFVINGWIKVIGLPTESSGLAVGEVYVDNGVLKVKTS